MVRLLGASQICFSGGAASAGNSCARGAKDRLWAPPAAAALPAPQVAVPNMPPAAKTAAAPPTTLRRDSRRSRIPLSLTGSGLPLVDDMQTLLCGIRPGARLPPGADWNA